MNAAQGSNNLSGVAGANQASPSEDGEQAVEGFARKLFSLGKKAKPKLTNIFCESGAISMPEAVKGMRNQKGYESLIRKVWVNNKIGGVLEGVRSKLQVNTEEEVTLFERLPRPSDTQPEAILPEAPVPPTKPPEEDEGEFSIGNVVVPDPQESRSFYNKVDVGYAAPSIVTPVDNKPLELWNDKEEARSGLKSMPGPQCILTVGGRGGAYMGGMDSDGRYAKSFQDGKTKARELHRQQQMLMSVLDEIGQRCLSLGCFNILANIAYPENTDRVLKAKSHLLMCQGGTYTVISEVASCPEKFKHHKPERTLNLLFTDDGLTNFSSQTPIDELLVSDLWVRGHKSLYLEVRKKLLEKEDR